MQGSNAGFADCLRIRSVCDQQLHCIEAAERCRKHQRSLTLGILVVQSVVFRESAKRSEIVIANGDICPIGGILRKRCRHDDKKKTELENTHCLLYTSD